MSVPSVKLNSGHSIPVVGLGCWMGQRAGPKENEDTVNMVKTALQKGYTHFDTASGYGNEEGVGKAIRESGVLREKLFVTTKLRELDHGRVAEAFEESFQRLNVDYIDLYLVHWPQAKDRATGETLSPSASPTMRETWADMEKLLETAKVKSIGVSNYSIKNLKLLLESAKVIPAVNQIEAHPYLPNEELLSFCKAKGIHFTAYSPIGQHNSPIITDPDVISIAKKNGKTTGQVVLSWAVQRGNVSVIPKSANPLRLAQNISIFTLQEEDFDAISNLHRQEGKHRRLCSYTGGLNERGKLFGWTFEEMGFDARLFGQ